MYRETHSSSSRAARLHVPGVQEESIRWWSAYSFLTCHHILSTLHLCSLIYEPSPRGVGMNLKIERNISAVKAAQVERRLESGHALRLSGRWSIRQKPTQANPHILMKISYWFYRTSENFFPLFDQLQAIFLTFIAVHILNKTNPRL